MTQPNNQDLIANQDLGETFYIVDSDYATAAAGWSVADGTGMLDLWQERNPNRVFYTPGGTTTASGSTDALAVQAAVNACISLRGDKLYFAPGAYSLATAVSVPTADLRIIAARRTNPRQSSATITAAVDLAIGLTAAAKRVEIGFLRFVPLTAKSFFSLAAGANALDFHDFFYDTRGITGSTATSLLTSSTAADHTIRNFSVVTDAAQGAPFIYTGAATGISFLDFTLWHGTGTTLPIALADFQGALTGGQIERGRGNLTGLASSAVTNLVKIFESGGDIQTLSIRDWRSSIGFCASNGLISLNTAEAAEIAIGACYLDVVSGGAGGVGTTFTA